MLSGDRMMVGVTQSPANEFHFRGNLIAATTTAAGGVVSLRNTTGVNLIVTDFILNIITGSTGAANLNIGTHATGAASSDNLMQAANAQTVRVQSNRGQAGANGGMARWLNGAFVVATATATTAGMVGTYHILAVAE